MRRFYLGVLLVVIIMSGCSSMKVMTKYDSSVNFKNYHTYRFVRPKRRKAQEFRHPFFTKEVMAQIKPMMEARGLTEVDSAQSPDLLVCFYAYVHREWDYIPPTYYYGRWGGVRYLEPGYMMHYKTGTLVIDVVDAKANEVVWQGVGKGILDRYDPYTDLAKAVSQVLKDFPPKE